MSDKTEFLLTKSGNLKQTSDENKGKYTLGEH